MPCPYILTSGQLIREPVCMFAYSEKPEAS